MSVRPLLAVVPARGGSKGLPGKNVRPLAGLPLLAHALEFARRCPAIDRCLVSTDSKKIAALARRYRGDVPFLRPAELAQDETPMLPVLQHALREVERMEGRRYETLLLLQPTNPARLPQDLARALALLDADPGCVGVIAVSEPAFNPRYVCVEEQAGYLRRLFSGGPAYTRRQDVPPVFRVNGMLYLFRRDYLLETKEIDVDAAPLRMLVLPRERAFDIDDLHDFQMAELALQAGLVKLPWLKRKRRGRK
ncbi:MAG TPA: acylneuraminate cytidylyltransferase family protein [Terriglobales bacterium]|nr:acylneuraminate cytidylyltransferase family protein [Terriglobales bacterium]